MNCLFCDKKMFLLKPEIGSANPQSKMCAYDCFRCPRSVRFFYTDDHLEWYVIFINKKDRNLNDHLYAVVFHPDSNKATLYGAEFIRYSTSTSYINSFEMHQPIAEFGNIPNITPSNIQDKLKLYLLFS